MAKMNWVSGWMILLSFLVMSCDPILYFRINGSKTYTDSFFCGKLEVKARDLNINPEYSLFLKLTTSDTVSLNLRHLNIEDSKGSDIEFRFASKKDSLDKAKATLSRSIGEKEIYIGIQKSSVTVGDTLILSYSKPIKCYGNDFLLDRLTIILNPEISKKD